MKVIIRTDASIWIGSGHVMRCLVLADALDEQGFKVVFACLSLKGDMISHILDRGYEVVILTKPQLACSPQYDSDYEGWLQRSSTEDAIDFLNCIQRADIVITDHYAIAVKWQAIVKKDLGCFIVAIDDLVREHCADIIIDQTLGRKGDEYCSPYQVLAGTKYALLSKRFAELRLVALERQVSLEKPRVLISMGGIDLPNSTLLVLKALAPYCEAVFTVLLSKRSPHFREVTEWCLQRENVKHIEFISDMASLMLEHDVAIGAPGSTSWERACLGLPSIIIPLAENQVEICRQLVQKGASLQVNLKDIDKHLMEAFRLLCNGWEDYHYNSLSVCDGNGAERVVKKIFRLINENNDHMQ